jgi:membrane protease YdiL (CAAX protease family)
MSSDRIARSEARLMTIQDAATPSQLETPARGALRKANRRDLIGAAWFVGLSLSLAVGTVVVGAAPALVPFVLAVGPAVVALTLARRESRGALSGLLHSLTIRPADRRWYLVVAIPVAWALATVAATVVLGEPVDGLFDALFPAILIIPLVVIVPAFTEELAWRGYALPRLLTSMSPLSASLLLAVPWVAMHLVLFLPGQWYADLALWPMVVSIVSYSILLTWIYVGTGGSVLMTGLFHAALNGVAPLMAGIDPDTSWAVRNLLAAGIAVGVVALGGLRRSDARS